MTTSEQDPDPRGYPRRPRGPRRQRRLIRRIVFSLGAFTLGFVATLLVATGIALWASTAHFKAFGGGPFPAELERMKSSARHADGRFSNEEPTGIDEGPGRRLGGDKGVVVRKGDAGAHLPLAHRARRR